MADKLGTVYLIHFNIGLPIRPGVEARHYMGFTEGNLDKRLEEHSKGRGSKLMAEVKRRGIGWEVVRTWGGVDRNFERKLKNRHESPRFCPICSQSKKDKRGLLK